MGYEGGVGSTRTGQRARVLAQFGESEAEVMSASNVENSDKLSVCFVTRLA